MSNEMNRMIEDYGKKKSEWNFDDIKISSGVCLRKFEHII